MTASALFFEGLGYKALPITHCQGDNQIMHTVWYEEEQGHDQICFDKDIICNSLQQHLPLVMIS